MAPIAGHLDDVRSGDVGLDALTVGAQLIPIWGGFLGALFATIRRRRVQTQNDFLVELAQQLDAVKGQLDEFVRGDEFAAFAEEVFEKGQRHREVEKRRYYAASLANTARPGRPEAELRWRMLDVLEQLRPNHLRLLAAVAGGVGGPPAEMHTRHAAEVLGRLLPDLGDRPDLLWLDLLRLNVFGEGLATLDGGQNLPFALSAFGSLFVAFIEPPGRSSAARKRRRAT